MFLVIICFIKIAREKNDDPGQKISDIENWLKRLVNYWEAAFFLNSSAIRGGGFKAVQLRNNFFIQIFSEGKFRLPLNSRGGRGGGVTALMALP